MERITGRPASAGPTSSAGAVLLLAALLPTWGCGGAEAPESVTSLSAPEFIDVVVAIRSVELELEQEDSAAALFQARKDSILAAHGTTEDALRRFVEANRDVHLMNAVWDSITQRLKHPLRHPRSRPQLEPDTPATRFRRPPEGPPALPGRPGVDTTSVPAAAPGTTGARPTRTGAGPTPTRWWRAASS